MLLRRRSLLHWSFVLAIFAAIYTNMPVSFACNAAAFQSLIGLHDEAYRHTTGVGSSVGCDVAPLMSGYACFPTAFTVTSGPINYKNYLTINSGVCATTNSLGTFSAGNNEDDNEQFQDWDWSSYQGNGDWGAATALSACSDATGNPPGPGGPNYNLCPAGHRMLARESFVVPPPIAGWDTYDLYCAFDSACTVAVGETCDNSPPAIGPGEGGPNACYNRAIDPGSDIACVYPVMGGSGLQGTCGACADNDGNPGNNPFGTPIPLPGTSAPAACDANAGVPCCNLNPLPGAVTTNCQPVFSSPVDLAQGLGESMNGCIADPPALYDYYGSDPDYEEYFCGSKGGTGMYCNSGSQCASGMCDFDGELIKHCLGLPSGSVCGSDSTGAEGGCVCGVDLECLPVAGASTEWRCQTDCLTNGAQCTMGTSCCLADLSTGEEYSCQIAAGLTPPLGTCQPTGVECTLNNVHCETGEPCCDPTRECVFEPALNDTRCMPVQCLAYENKPCSIAADCCPISNPDLSCINGTCSSTGGTQCSVEGACCADAPGLTCHSGSCTYDANSDCISYYTPPGYTGPIINFEQVIATIFGFLYPVGIILGIVFNIKAGYCFMTSEGNPQTLKECQEELTHAILGTLFILLSIAILRVIINTFLGVPGTVSF